MSQADVNAAPSSAPPMQGVEALSGSLKGPGYPKIDPEVTCPSCGRFAGTYERCPFCGARMAVRLSIRALRRLSLVVGILGVAILFAAAPYLEVPLQEVRSFSPTSNFAILRIRGQLIGEPLYGDRGDSFYAGVDDGTGRINLKAYGKASEGLKLLGLGAGDTVEAQGSIRVEAGKAPSMFIAVARHVRRVDSAQGGSVRGALPRQGGARPAPPLLKVSAIGKELAAQKALIRVEGTIRRTWSTDSGTGGDLDDGSGKLVVWLYENERAAMGEAFGRLVGGARLRVTGKLSSYRTKAGEEIIQLRPQTRPDAIEVLPGEAAAVAPVPAPQAPAVAVVPAADPGGAGAVLPAFPPPATATAVTTADGAGS